VANWMDVLAPETYGAIKDPADNFFEIDTSGIVQVENLFNWIC